MSDKIAILIGYSGHAYVVAEAAIEMGIDLQYYSDINQLVKNPFELRFLGDDNAKDFLGWNRGLGFILGIGDNKVREDIGIKIAERNESLLTIIHPSASIAKYAKIGNGVFLSRNVSINSFVTIGDYSIVNTGSILEHECSIGIAVHIAPGAVLAGNVTVGDRSFIGANAVVKQGVVIGKNVIIGAGAVVLKNLPDNTIVAGNPARQIDR